MNEYCPECNRVVGIVTYTCRVPGCLQARFCSPHCIGKHMGNHVRERDEQIAKLRAALEEIEKYNNQGNDLEAYLSEVADWGLGKRDTKPDPVAFGVG